jgi:hypothetical protein
MTCYIVTKINIISVILLLIPNIIEFNSYEKSDENVDNLFILRNEKGRRYFITHHQLK